MEWWWQNAFMGGPDSYFAMFMLGLVTGLNPCMLTMLPVAAGYAGSGVLPRQRVLFTSMAFVAGFTLVLALIGALAVQVGPWLIEWDNTWRVVIGGVYIGAGLVLLKSAIRFRLTRLPLVYGFFHWAPWHRLAKAITQGGPSGAFRLGSLFGLTPSPCATPVALVVVTTVAPTGSALQAAGLLLAFGIGHSLFLMAAALFGGQVVARLASGRWRLLIKPMIGLFLMILGLVLLLSGNQEGASIHLGH